jgi:hypothetical protein
MFRFAETKNDNLFRLFFSIKTILIFNSISIRLNKNSFDPLLKLLCLVCDSLVFVKKKVKTLYIISYLSYTMK